MHLALQLFQRVEAPGIEWLDSSVSSVLFRYNGILDFFYACTSENEKTKDCFI